MTTHNARSRKTLTAAAVVLLVAALAVWGFSRRSESTAVVSTLPKELSVESLKAQANNPGQLIGTVRAGFRNPELTDKQRRELAMNMREVWRSMLRERVDEYFDASAGNRQAILDQHIDDLQERMKDLEKRREEWLKQREKGQSDFRRAFASRTQQERKEQSEAKNPDQMARTMSYFSALSKRMSQRGIKTPWGRRGQRRGLRNR